MVYPTSAGPGVQLQNDGTVRLKHMTPLMRAKHVAAEQGGVANACEFGCTVEDLNELGYCKHLVGFTTDGKTFEPRKLNAHGYEFVDGTDPKPVLPGDVKIWVTTSARVYRKDGNVPRGKARE